MPENNTSDQGVLPEASEGQSGRGLKLTFSGGPRSAHGQDAGGPR